MPGHVVVIGGGLAGLACARRLADVGVPVTIVESSDDIGGRVKQISHNGESYELGAEFLHGGAASAKALADACGARTSRVFTAAHGDGGPDDAHAPDGGVALYHVEGRTLPLASGAVRCSAEPIECAAVIESARNRRGTAPCVTSSRAREGGGTMAERRGKRVAAHKSRRGG